MKFLALIAAIAFVVAISGCQFTCRPVDHSNRCHGYCVPCDPCPRSKAGPD